MVKLLRETSSAPTHDEIAAQAYEIYLREGCVTGRELDHWFQAEFELRNGHGNANGNGQSQEILRAPGGQADIPKTIATPSAEVAAARPPGARRSARR